MRHQSVMFRNEDGKLYVEVLDKDQKIRKEIDVGMRGDGGMVEVLRGLEGGEKIVLP